MELERTKEEQDTLREESCNDMELERTKEEQDTLRKESCNNMELERTEEEHTTSEQITSSNTDLKDDDITTSINEQCIEETCTDNDIKVNSLQEEDSHHGNDYQVKDDNIGNQGNSNHESDENIANQCGHVDLDNCDDQSLCSNNLVKIEDLVKDLDRSNHGNDESLVKEVKDSDLSNDVDFGNHDNSVDEQGMDGDLSNHNDGLDYKLSIENDVDGGLSDVALQMDMDEERDVEVKEPVSPSESLPSLNHVTVNHQSSASSDDSVPPLMSADDLSKLAAQLHQPDEEPPKLTKMECGLRLTDLKDTITKLQSRGVALDGVSPETVQDKPPSFEDLPLFPASSSCDIDSFPPSPASTHSESSVSDSLERSSEASSERNVCSRNSGRRARRFIVTLQKNGNY
jgi:hypothetical protein